VDPDGLEGACPSGPCNNKDKPKDLKVGALTAAAMDSPDYLGNKKGTVSRGQVLPSSGCDSSGYWYKVRLPNGEEAWVPKSAVYKPNIKLSTKPGSGPEPPFDEEAVETGGARVTLLLFAVMYRGRAASACSLTLPGITVDPSFTDTISYATMPRSPTTFVRQIARLTINQLVVTMLRLDLCSLFKFTIGGVCRPSSATPRSHTCSAPLRKPTSCQALILTEDVP
ncbi:MAG TPA: SH3 domain-containing protein, partial [Chloroflexota bacterium]|nr:SH3 domain-containing protein [Chloroflexota bacterium]